MVLEEVGVDLSVGQAARPLFPVDLNDQIAVQGHSTGSCAVFARPPSIWRAPGSGRGRSPRQRNKRRASEIAPNGSSFHIEHARAGSFRIPTELLRLLIKLWRMPKDTATRKAAPAWASIVMRPRSQVVKGERHVRRDIRADEVLEAASKTSRPVPAFVTSNPDV